jgi:hypothetical protein
MIRYEASIPRAACSMAAIAMTALVFGLAVVLPAATGTGPEIGMATAVAGDYVTAECTPSPAADAA